MCRNLQDFNKLNPSFMKNIFAVKKTNRLTREQYKPNLNTTSYNQMTFGYKSLLNVGPKSQSKLPYHIKSSKSLNNFIEPTKNWDGTRSNCKICEFLIKFFIFGISMFIVKPSLLILTNTYCFESVLISYRFQLLGFD